MAVYICTQCKFCFERKSVVENCPDCGRTQIRHATKDENAEYKRIKAELKDGNQNHQLNWWYAPALKGHITGKPLKRH